MTGPAPNCPGCGAPVPAGDRFCRSCGRAVSTLEPAPPPEVAAPTPMPPAATSTPEPISDWTKPVGGGAPASPPPQPTQPAEPTSDWTKPVGGGAPASPPPQRAQPSSDWTRPVGGPGQPRPPSGGSRLGGALRGLGRGAVGCLAILVALGVIGGILANLEGPGATERAHPTYAAGTVPVMPTAEPYPAETEAQLLQVGLAEAIATDLVTMTATGQNLQELALGLDSLTDAPLAVTIAAGTVFTPAASGTQAMVVITEATLDVWPDRHVDFILDVACAAMSKDTPGSSDAFTISTTPISSDLGKLIASTGFAEADFRVQQFAIWTITDNPARSGYVGLGTFGVGSGPSNVEISEIKALFKAAGIDSSTYRALR